jgi:hypothetical protein
VDVRLISQKVKKLKIAADLLENLRQLVGIADFERASTG